MTLESSGSSNASDACSDTEDGSSSASSSSTPTTSSSTGSSGSSGVYQQAYREVLLVENFRHRFFRLGHAPCCTWC